MSENPIKFRFAGIEIIAKSLSEIRPTNLINTNVLFDLKIEVKVQAELKMVLPYVTVKIRSAEIPDYLASFIIACFFEVEDFDNAILLNEQGLHVIPPELDMTIRPVSISTARGIIYSELKGTYLQNSIMPVVYMNTLTPEPPIETVEQ